MEGSLWAKSKKNKKLLARKINQPPKREIVKLQKKKSISECKKESFQKYFLPKETSKAFQNFQI